MAGPDDWRFALTLLAALGCGLVAGVFFAFSSFVMKALARRPAPEGIAAMQSINIVVINPWFMGVFLGTAAVCTAEVVLALLQLHAPGAALRLAGGVLYLAGCLAVTLAFNVPKNDALASARPDDPQAAALWTRYVAEWTAWNHVRTVAPLIAAVAFILALAR